MGRVLGIVYRVIATHLIKKAGQTHKMAHTSAVTLIQRFGSALKKSQGAIFNSRRRTPKGRRAWIARNNLNIHFHMECHGWKWLSNMPKKALRSAPGIAR